MNEWIGDAAAWFMQDPIRTFIAFGIMIAAFGVFLVRLSFYEFEHHPDHRRKPIADPWDRDHTGEFLVPRGTFGEPMPAVDTRASARHRASDMEGGTTNLAPYVPAVRAARARAMMPLPPRVPGEELRRLRRDWRDEWTTEEADGYGDYPR